MSAKSPFSPHQRKFTHRCQSGRNAEAELEAIMADSELAKKSARRRNAVIAGENSIQRGLALRDRPMSEVIPFRKPPSKPKEDETAEFLKLLERIQKSIKSK
jgi:hypothetical protein